MGDKLTVERSRSKTCGKGFCESNAFKIEIRRLVSKIEQKDKEIEILRQYGNKDCTAMADEALTNLNQPDKG